MTDHRILDGLLWLATSPDPSPYSTAEAVCRGVGSLRRAGVPDALVSDAYRSTLEPTPALAAVRRWAAEPIPRQTWDPPLAAGELAPTAPRQHGVLVLRGPVGTGKSAAAAKLLALRIASGSWRARWVDCRSLVADDFSRVNALIEIIEAPCIVLDDFSADAATRKEARKAIIALVAQRHERGALTIITSNLSATCVDDANGNKTSAIEAAFGPALWDRIGQDGEVVDCEGPSLRKRVERTALDATVVNAERLVALVRRLGHRVGEVSSAVIALEHGEAVAQLGRLLGVGRGAAARAAEEVEAHDRRQAEAFAEIRARLSGGLRRPPGHVEQPADELAAERRRLRAVGHEPVND